MPHPHLSLHRYPRSLEHWGSDQTGVNRTRRFLLEFLSWLWRYVPVALLERPDTLPQRMGERPPPLIGRDDLETLMASPRAADWVALSEMLLGPVPDDFVFVPKHKSSGPAAGSKRPAAGRPAAEGDDDDFGEGEG